MRYRCILADPPWPFRDQGSRIAPAHAGHYQVKPMRDILASDGAWVRQIAAEDSFLFLWTPSSLLLDGTARRVCRAWGFDPKQIATWLKTTASGTPAMGMGHYMRNCTEHMVLARRGTPSVVRRDMLNHFEAPRGRHSAKPDAAYEIIEELCEGPYLELYARRRYSERWTAWGDQVAEEAR